MWNIGNGRSIKVWSDNWLEAGRNIMDYQVQIPDELVGARVSDLINENGV